MRVIAFIVFEVFSAAKIALLREVRLQRPEYVAIWRRRAAAPFAAGGAARAFGVAESFARLPGKLH